MYRAPTLALWLGLCSMATAATWTADFEEFDDMVGGQFEALHEEDYGPFRWYDGVVYRERGFNFTVEGQQWATLTAYGSSGPASITTSWPATLTGGYFRALYNTLTVGVDINYSDSPADFVIHELPLEAGWNLLELDIPFERSLSFTTCDARELGMYGSACFSSKSINWDSWGDLLTFDVVGEQSIGGGPGGSELPAMNGREFEGSGNAVIPEPPGLGLGIGLAAMVMAWYFFSGRHHGAD
jgi:hypothetical protein